MARLYLNSLQNVNKAATSILRALKDVQSPLSLPEIIRLVKAKQPKVRERDLRPAFWCLAQEEKISVDSRFRASIKRSEDILV